MTDLNDNVTSRKRVLKKTRVTLRCYNISHLDVITSKRPIDQFQSNAISRGRIRWWCIWVHRSISVRSILVLTHHVNVHLMNTHATHPNLQDWPWQHESYLRICISTHGPPFFRRKFETRPMILIFDAFHKQSTKRSLFERNNLHIFYYKLRKIIHVNFHLIINFSYITNLIYQLLKSYCINSSLNLQKCAKISNNSKEKLNVASGERKKETKEKQRGSLIDT